jgi:beta-galactosidase beta subunit
MSLDPTNAQAQEALMDLYEKCRQYIKTHYLIQKLELMEYRSATLEEERNRLQIENRHNYSLLLMATMTLDIDSEL